MIETPETPAGIGRIRALVTVIGTMLMVIVMRLWYLQVAHGEDFLEASINNRRRDIKRYAPRGMIVDSRGRSIAGNRSQLIVTVIPFELKRAPNAIWRLARILGKPIEELTDLLEAPIKHDSPSSVRVAEDISDEIVTAVEENRISMPGVYVIAEPVREYNVGAMMGHVIGQLGRATREDLEQDSEDELGKDDRIGRIGLEGQYEDVLRGRKGRKVVEVDARGRVKSEVDNLEAIPGATLKLCIDLDLQKTAYDALEEWGTGRHRRAKLNGHPGAAVALDVRDGSVLALASYPSYDPGMFVKNVSPQYWESLNTNPLKPQINRAVGSAYAPGSTFKVVPAAAGLETGEATLSSSDYCSGSIKLGIWTKHCHAVHGYVDFYSAFARSCDIFYYHLGQRLRPERMAEYARKFGLGSRTGIDLARTESAGVVPDPEWKRKHKRGPWVGGDTVDFAIGQASLACTPLQMANITAAIANGGTLYRPHVVREVTRFDSGSQKPIVEPVVPVKISNLGLSDTTINRLQKAMRSVMLPGGTASQAAIPGLTMAGKTGTAQVSVKGQGMMNNSWFICYAPVEKPQIAICVFVEHGGHGGDAAAPIARRMLSQYFHVPLDGNPGETGLGD